jgi:hypothetical protein
MRLRLAPAACDVERGQGPAPAAPPACAAAPARHGRGVAADGAGRPAHEARGRLRPTGRCGAAGRACALARRAGRDAPGDTRPLGASGPPRPSPPAGRARWRRAGAAGDKEAIAVAPAPPVAPSPRRPAPPPPAATAAAAHSSGRGAAAPPGDGGASRAGRTLPRGRPDDGRRRGAAAPRPAPHAAHTCHTCVRHRTTGAASLAAACARQAPALRAGTAGTRLGAAAAAARRALLSPVPAAAAGVAAPRPPGPDRQCGGCAAARGDSGWVTGWAGQRRSGRSPDVGRPARSR